MIRTFRAELARLARRRVLLVTAVATLVFSVGAAAIVLASATTTPSGPNGRGATLASLAQSGGGSEVFARGISFTGTFLFVVFIGAFAIDFSRGTVRTMLLRQPRRVRLLAGRLAGLLTFAAAWLAVAEVVTWVTARLLASSQDVSAARWVSLDALGAGVSDYGRAVAWVSGYAVLAMAVAVLLRSVPVALGVGIAWAGPIEHLVSDAWTAAFRFFPGLLLEAFAAGGTRDVSAGRALLTIAIYGAVAAVVAGTLFARRDVTA